MTRAVYVGGLDTGRGMVRRVANEIGERYGYDDVVPFTAAAVERRPEVLRVAAKGADAWAHATGAVHLEGLSPGGLYLMNPPFPRESYDTWRETLEDNLRLIADKPLWPVARYAGGTLVHMVTNFGSTREQLGSISRFDGWAVAESAARMHIETEVICTAQDGVYPPDQEQIDRARQAGVTVTVLAGSHNEVVFDPRGFLDAYDRHRGGAQPQPDANSVG